MLSYSKLAKDLKGIADLSMSKLLNNKYKWLAEDRSKIASAVIGVIRKHFVAREGSSPDLQFGIDNLENILTCAKTERTYYDFKIGLHDLNEKCAFNKGVVSKIVRTLSAMVNSNAGKSVTILGVADKERDAKIHEEIYGVKARSFGYFYVTGIEDEANRHHGSLDQYEQKLVQYIENEPIDEAFKRLILRNLSTFSYYDKHVTVMEVHREEEPVKYDGKIYVRKGSHNDPKPIESEIEFYKEFIAQKERYPYS